MAATITRGYTFGSTELVTNTKLHTLVDAATISNFNESNLASGRGLVVRSTSAPSNTNCIWVDTNFSPPLVKVYSGSSWVVQGPYAVLTNKSAGQRTAGEVVVADTTTDSAFTTTTSPDVPALGVVMETIAQNASGVVALPGAFVTSVLAAATTTRGQTLSTCATAGKVTPSGVNACILALDDCTGAATLGAALVIGPTLVPAAGAGAVGQFLKSLGAGAVPVFADVVDALGTVISTLKIKCISFAGGSTTVNKTIGGAHTVSHDSTGIHTVTWAGTAFEDAYYFIAGSCSYITSNQEPVMDFQSKAAGSVIIRTGYGAWALADPAEVVVIAIGT